MKLYPTLIDRLKNQHDAIPEIINKVSPMGLLVRPQPERWHIKDNIAHLARYQPVALNRIKAILLSDTPTFERYRAEDDPKWEAWRKMEIPLLLERLKTDRKEIVSFITGIQESSLSKTGRHRKFGVLSIIGWTEFFLLHEAHHIYTIWQLANDVELQKPGK